MSKSTYNDKLSDLVDRIIIAMIESGSRHPQYVGADDIEHATELAERLLEERKKGE